MEDQDRNRFVFHFSDSDFEGKGFEVPAATYFFFLNADTSKDYSDEHEDDIIDFSSEMEEYGVHDWSTTGNPDGTWREVAGYNSYEIRADKWDEVMEKWRAWFEKEGWQPGEVQKLTPKEYEKRFYPWVKRHEVDEAE